MNGRAGCNSVSIGEGIISKHRDLHGFYFTLRGLCFRRTDLVPPLYLMRQLTLSHTPIYATHVIMRLAYRTIFRRSFHRNLFSIVDKQKIATVLSYKKFSGHNSHVGVRIQLSIARTSHCS
jgi:hypothetical protein